MLSAFYPSYLYLYNFNRCTLPKPEAVGWHITEVGPKPEVIQARRSI